jgi:hypothetical protein
VPAFADYTRMEHGEFSLPVPLNLSSMHGYVGKSCRSLYRAQGQLPDFSNVIDLK